MKFVCGECGTDVTGRKDAIIHVHHHDISVARSMRQVQPGASDIAEWKIHCANCAPDGDECFCYWISMDRMATAEDVLARTTHLMKKDWLKLTNWHEVIEDAST